jgi:hypothetical protein
MAGEERSMHEFLPKFSIIAMGSHTSEFSNDFSEGRFRKAMFHFEK